MARRMRVEVPQLRTTEAPTADLWLAYWMLALLTVVIGVPLTMLWTHHLTLDDAQKLVPLLMGPIVGLVGPILGFYYGSQVATADGTGSQSG
jgi:hypothetical protein